MRGLAPVSLALLFAGATVFYWHGVGPGDAERYLEAALRWRDGPFLGETHWALRHLFVLPMASAFAALGTSEAAAILPNVVYAALTVALTWWFARRHLGEREAFIAAALIATSAFFVARPLELDVYGAEAFFAALSCWLFLEARRAARPFALLTAAGLAAGLAWTVREQAVYLLAAFALLLVNDRREAWRSLVFIAAGFGAVIAAELLLYAVVAGDPFHRYLIDLGHRDIGVNANMTPERARLPMRALRAATSWATTPATTPMLLLAAGCLAFFRPVRAAFRAAPALPLFLAVAGVSAVLTPLAFNLSSTRYYPMLTYAAFLVVAVAIARLSATRRNSAIAAAAAVIAVNAAAADFTRDGDYGEARALARMALSSNEPLFADALTVNRARYLLRLGGLGGEAASDKVRNVRYAGPGSLVFRTARAGIVDAPACVLQRINARRNGWTHKALRDSGAARLLGARIEAVAAEPRPVIVLRLLAKPAAVDPVTGKPCLPD